MKKKTKIILALITSGVLLSSIIPIGISIENRRISDALRTTKNIVERRFGCYNGAIAFYRGDADLMAAPCYTVAGYTFFYTTANVIEIFKDNEIYGIPEAYEKKIITAANVKEIHRRYENYMFWREVKIEVSIKLREWEMYLKGELPKD